MIVYLNIYYYIITCSTLGHAIKYMPTTIIYELSIFFGTLKENN